MPPRHVYWTIILEGAPTAFRAHTPEELLPTLKQLQARHPDTVMKWFARGRLWDSPEQERMAAALKKRTPQERRPDDWRPGGEHRDPRARFKVPREEKRRRFAAKARRDRMAGPPGDGDAEHRGPDQRPPRQAPNGTGDAPKGRTGKPPFDRQRPAPRFERPPRQDRDRSERAAGERGPRPDRRFPDRGSAGGPHGRPDSRFRDREPGADRGPGATRPPGPKFGDRRPGGDRPPAGPRAQGDREGGPRSPSPKFRDRPPGGDRRPTGPRPPNSRFRDREPGGDRPPGGPRPHGGREGGVRPPARPAGGSPWKPGGPSRRPFGGGPRGRDQRGGGRGRGGSGGGGGGGRNQ